MARRFWWQHPLVRPWLKLLGRGRSFWWGVVRSEPAQRRSIVAAEIAWCGKGLSREEIDEFIVEQRPAWRCKSYPWHRWLYGDGER